MSQFESNLSMLASRQPELAALLRETPLQKMKVFPSVSGVPTASWQGPAGPVALHSRYDPMREARQKLSVQQYQGADYIVLLGFGLGYILESLLAENPAASMHYFVIESDLEILRAAFESRDLTPIFAAPHVHFAWPVTGPELAEQWQHFFDPVYAQKNVFVTHLPSISLNSALFKSAAEIIQSQIFQTFTDINTLVAKSETFLDNFIQNLPKAAQAPGVIKFTGLFQNIPAVIVSAGPSLDKNIHELRGHEDNVLILATDTAIKPLLAAGIDPHFVLTGDPSYANYLHLKGASTKEALLVAEATSYPAVFDEFRSRTVACIFENSSLQSLSDLLGNKGTIRAWGSVATMALDFALLLKCNPITFIGQDLAHTDGRMYCSGVYFDEEWFKDTDSPEAWQSQMTKLRSGRRTITVDDIFGRPIESTDKLTSYWNWILKVIHSRPDVRFINATEGGILAGGTEISSLREVIYRHCRKTLGLREQVNQVFLDAQKDSLLYSGINLQLLAGEIKALRDVLTLGRRLCEARNYAPDDLRKRLESTKESIYFNPHIAPLLDCLNQMGNVTFLRRQKALAQKPSNPDLRGEIQTVYSEYFVSVGEALGKVEKALARIGFELSLNEGNSRHSAPSEERKNRYSRKPGMSIS